LPDALPLTDLFPLFVPASFFELGNWPGPYEILKVSGLGLTWAVELPNQMMLYVDKPTTAHWDQLGINWRQLAIDNLTRRSEAELFTGQFPRSDDPDRPYAVVFMHPDGYGPSRLLLRAKLQAIFPQGYLVGLPEMSCAIAVASDATEAERANMADLVDKCHSSGTRPLVPGLHDPSLLAVSEP